MTRILNFLLSLVGSFLFSCVRHYFLVAAAIAGYMGHAGLCLFLIGCAFYNRLCSIENSL